MENIGINKKSPEEIKAWREENKEKLNPQHEMVRMPDGTMEEITEENKDELHEVVSDEHNDLR